MIQRIQTAMRVKCPVTAVSVPGRAPWRGRTDILRKSLKGLTIIHAKALPADRENGTILRVDAVGKGVKAKRLFYSLNLDQAKRMVEDWSQSERRRRQRAALTPKLEIARGQKRYYAAITKLERELSKLDLRPPENTLLGDLKHAQRIRQYRLEAEEREAKVVENLSRDNPEVEWKPSLTPGQQWALWKSQAALRVKLWHLSREVLNGKRTVVQLYRQAESLGCKVRKYGSIPERERERLGITHAEQHVEKFWQFCGLSEKPWGFEPHKIGKRAFGPEHYADWLSEVRQAKALRSQIENIRGMVE